jgi:hypothetical protein
MRVTFLSVWGRASALLESSPQGLPHRRVTSPQNVGQGFSPADKYP